MNFPPSRPPESHRYSSAHSAHPSAQSKRFFALPPNIKTLAAHPPSGAHHRGYSAPGIEQVSQHVYSAAAIAGVRATRPDIKETFDLGNERDPLQPNIWLPDRADPADPRPLLPGFRPFMTAFFADLARLVHALLDALSLALRLPEARALPPTHAQSLFQLRLLRYPPAAPGVSRITPHSDFGTLTLLLQDAVGGLEVQVPDPDAEASRTARENGGERAGTWVPLPPPPSGRRDIIIVNVGDLMERWSNGRWKSTMHRVVGRSEDQCQERFSVACFATADPETVIEALPGTWEGKGRRYDSCTAWEYVQMRMKALYQEGGDGAD